MDSLVKRPRTAVTSGENLKRKNELLAWCSGSAPVEERRLPLLLPSIARLNTRMNQVFRPFDAKHGRKPETRVQIPAGAPQNQACFQLIFIGKA